MTKLQKILIAVFAAITIVFSIATVIRDASGEADTTTEYKEKLCQALREQDEVMSESVTKYLAKNADNQLTLEEQTAEEQTPEEQALEEQMAEGSPDVDLIEISQEEKDELEENGEFAYADQLSDEEVDSIIEFFEEQPDVDQDDVAAFVEKYAEYLEDYERDKDGNLLVPLSDESLMQTDDTRPLAAVEMGLNKKPINDALAFPFELSEEQVKKILAAKGGQKVNFTEEEIDALRVELFREFAGNPILFEAWMRLLTDQNIGQKVDVRERWAKGREFMNLSEISRDLEPWTGGTAVDPYANIRGKGMNIWLRKVNGKHYTKPDYQEYVLAMIYLLLPVETDVEVLTAQAGDHYNLIPGEPSSTRVAEPADYKETLASLVFKIYDKTGRVAIKIGANLRDKRPEILNYTVVKKPVPESTPAPVNTAKPSPTAVATTQPSQATTTTANTPETTPTIEPTKPPKKEEEGKKSPKDDNANAETDHKDDDPGPGEKKPDIGDSKSDKVEDSQYTQGTSTNTDGADQSNYDSGSAADATDNGNVPDTSAPENQIGTGEGTSNESYTDTQTGQTGDGGNNATKISAPPVTDD